MNEEKLLIHKITDMCIDAQQKGIHIFFDYFPHCCDNGCFDVSYRDTRTGAWETESEIVYIADVDEITVPNLEKALCEIERVIRKFEEVING